MAVIGGNGDDIVTADGARPSARGIAPLPPVAYPLCFVSDDTTDRTTMSRSFNAAAYWRRNLTYVAVLLAIWFAVSYGAGILFVDALNAVRIPGTGFPLGFWFAQQGSIYTFVLLIVVYVRLMNRLDREFDVDEIDSA
jgi:putative solute:sodium symporter small subunit